MNQQSTGHCQTSASLFQIESLPFSDIPHQSKLFLEYQKNPGALRQFYPSAPETHAEISRSIQRVLANYKTDRSALCSRLAETNKNFGAARETLENINLLRESDSVAVVTGQQAGLFSGAVYTIYKALSAVKMAACLRGRGIKAVPVFWIAEEDHDFDEVKKTFVLDGEGKLAALENTPQNYTENSPVGSVKLDQTIKQTIDEFFDYARYTEFSDDLRQILTASYNGNETYSSAFAKFLTKIFAPYGLIIFSPLDKGLKALSAPIFSEAVKKSDEIRRELLARNAELTAQGYDAQVLVEEDFFPFFWIDETGARRALKRQRDGKIRAKDTRREFDLAELMEIAAEQPENLSPNALMRPVVQDYLLPTAVYFGGGAEIAYFAQNSTVYEVLQRPATPILHRQSFTVIEARHRRTLRKYDLSFTDLFDGFESILPGIVEKYLTPETARVFAEAEEIINTQLNRLDQTLALSEPGLAENLARRRRKILYHIGALRTKFHYAQIRRDATVNRRIETALAALLPHKALQERTLNVLTFLNAHGLYFIDWIYAAIDLDDKAHRIIYL
ncbi:MAG TPA: bacillithiol biosynthesis cysteine-adding enzyme BshC [Pyrinomonadaceae bacterium]